MRKSALIALLLSPFISNAQHEIGAGLSGTYATQKPSGVDVISSAGGFFYYGYTAKLNRKFSVYPQIQIGETRYIMDGMFKSDNAGYSFDVTPANYKQSTLDMYTAKVPVLLRYNVKGDSPNRSHVSVGAGPYAEYTFLAIQKSKIENVNKTEDAAIENKLNYGFAAEISLATYSKKLSLLFPFSCGASYQISEFLSNSTSFNPLCFYAKLGVGF